ncbi:carbohydrate kinase [Pendulispora rubella]|uniref:Carbohydrate kinase n=1 Tax=Pendulispora rubella TaxID=2741070 RepID=A0ABZ2KSA1_9BACT
MTILGIDIGTSVIKAVVFDDGGTERAMSRESSAVLRPRPGHSEQDMRALWNAIARAVRKACSGMADSIEAITLTGQGDGVWLVDAQAAPVGHAILWNDARAASIVERWTAEGRIARGFDLNGSRTFAGAPNAILAWLGAHEPERLERAHAALSCTGFAFLRMTGRFGMDRSDASLPFLDIRTGAVAEDMFALFGIESARRLRPPILADTDRVGTLRQEAAEHLELRAGIPVVLAPYDIACMALGTGAVAHGQASAILGTTVCSQIMLDGPDVARQGIGINIDVFGKTLRAFPSLVGCEVMDWMSGIMGLGSAAELDKLALEAPPGANGLVLLPYMSPAGERAPFFDPRARGALFGLGFRHDRRDLARATLEALAFVVRDCFEAAPSMPTEIRVCGGGARSDVWCQIVADVTGVGVLRSQAREIGARGALVAANVVLRGRALREEAARLGTIEMRFSPDTRNTTLYTDILRHFRELRRAAGIEA